jgi:hypothetical protein
MDVPFASYVVAEPLMITLGVKQKAKAVYASPEFLDPAQ